MVAHRIFGNSCASSHKKGKTDEETMNATSPKSSLAKLGLYPRQKSLKVMVLGQSGIGKTAMVVRFTTRRYIGEYDPTLERIYTYATVIDKELVSFEILDTAGQTGENEYLGLEANIRWAEAFILMYSVTDKCSFDECYRLKFLINYNKRRRKLGGSSKDNVCDVPVVLVGNKIDQVEDRMVSLEEGQRRSKEIGCVCFHEISVRESIEQVLAVFRDVCRFWRVHSKNPIKLRRSGSEREQISPETSRLFSAISPSNLIPHSIRPSNSTGKRCTEVEAEDDGEGKEGCASSPNEPVPFRGRASTDGHLQQRPWRWRYPPPSSTSTEQVFPSSRIERRMSISMRGNKASY